MIYHSAGSQVQSRKPTKREGRRSSGRRPSPCGSDGLSNSEGVRAAPRRVATSRVTDSFGCTSLEARSAAHPRSSVAGATRSAGRDSQGEPMSPEVSHYQGDNRPLSAASVVAPETFILATRDTGYRDIASALAELVDNSVQAAATKILIAVDESRPATRSGFTVSVLDNGSGMAADTLRAALRFGGTNRFGSREGIGRFGMGLPNSSVSQARRLDVYFVAASWPRIPHVPRRRCNRPWRNGGHSDSTTKCAAGGLQKTLWTIWHSGRVE